MMTQTFCTNIGITHLVPLSVFYVGDFADASGKLVEQFTCPIPDPVCFLGEKLTSP